MSGTNKPIRYFTGELVLFALIVVFAGLSFAPCIAVYSVSGIDADRVSRFSYHSGYLTFVSVAVSVVELILLYRRKGLAAKLIGLVLDLLATAVPLPFYRWLESQMGGIIPQQHVYSLTTWGYAIISVGAVIAVFYLLLTIVPSWRQGSDSC